MREIEFRGKREDTGEWVYGDLLKTLAGGTSSVIVRGSIKVGYDVAPETIGEYTGLKAADSNRYRIVDGKEEKDLRIFEGDILECERYIPNTNFKKEKFRHVVNFDYGTFFALQEYMFGKIIIGNIHDTPELLGPEKENTNDYTR